MSKCKMCLEICQKETGTNTAKPRADPFCGISAKMRVGVSRAKFITVSLFVLRLLTSDRLTVAVHVVVQNKNCAF